MNLKEIKDLTFKRLKLQQNVPVIEAIIENAINYAYSDLSSLDKRTATAYVPIINGEATLPEDYDTFVKCKPKLDNNDTFVGNKILTNKTGVLEITYTTVPAPLVNDTDVPDLSPKYHYLLSTYACYSYYLYNKNMNLADIYLSEYERVKNKYNDTGYIEMVGDVYANG